MVYVVSRFVLRFYKQRESQTTAAVNGHICCCLIYINIYKLHPA